MSYQAVSWILDNATVTGQPKVLLLALADRCEANSAVCWPGMTEMMRRTGTRKSACLRLLQVLTEAGEVEVIKSERQGMLRKYRLLRYEDSLAPCGPNDPDVNDDNEVRISEDCGPNLSTMRSESDDNEVRISTTPIVGTKGTEGTTKERGAREWPGAGPEREEVMDYAASWKYDQRTGISGPIPAAVALKFWSHYHDHDKPFPKRWQSRLVNWFLEDCVKSRTAKNGAAGNSYAKPAFDVDPTRKDGTQAMPHQIEPVCYDAMLAALEK